MFYKYHVWYSMLLIRQRDKFYCRQQVTPKMTRGLKIRWVLLQIRQENKMWCRSPVSLKLEAIIATMKTRARSISITRVNTRMGMWAAWKTTTTKVIARAGRRQRVSRETGKKSGKEMFHKVFLKYFTNFKYFKKSGKEIFHKVFLRQQCCDIPEWSRDWEATCGAKVRWKEKTSFKYSRSDFFF